MSDEQVTQNTLEVPGARLYYETKGSGPILLLIPGANGDNTIFKPVRQYLSEHYTVVTYDRRGFSKSELIGTQDSDEHRLQTDANDVRRLITHLTDQPALIFGSSSGAIVALQVFILFPNIVHTLIAHEPPALNLLPDAGQWKDHFLEVFDIYRKSGIKDAMKKFTNGIVSGEEAKMMEDASNTNRGEYALKNQIYWFEHELRPYPIVNLDIEVLRLHANRLILACGLETKGQFPYLPNVALAKLLQKEVFHLPGGHIGYVFHAAEFARLLMVELRKGVVDIV